MFSTLSSKFFINKVTALSLFRFYSNRNGRTAPACCLRLVQLLRCSDYSFGYVGTPMYSWTQRRHGHFKVAVLENFGEKLAIKEVKRQSKLKENELRIKVHYCAVNVTDSLICAGEYEPKPKLPFMPGYEFSGEIKEVGPGVTGFSEGEKVIGLSKENFSAMGEECVVLSKDVWKVSSDVSFENAVALADSYATALIAARRANLSEGDYVLVTAGSGELGLASVDIAANFFKATVIGACDAENKAAILREKGAFSTINYSKEDVKESVMKATKNCGVKVVLDAVGGDIFDKCLESVSPEGSVVVMGFASRKVPKILTSQLLPRACAVIGVSLTQYRDLLHETYRETVQEVIDMYAEEFLEPNIAVRYRLDEVNDAFKFIEQRKSLGKVIVDID